MGLYNPPQVTVTTANSSTSTPSSVSAGTTSATILAANSNRIGATIWNNSTANLFIDLDSAVSATDFSAKISPGGYYELPFRYTGIITGIWDAANGNALVRELT
jgi:hypothetical protein